MGRQQPVNQQDDYFSAPRSLTPGGPTYDASNGSFELVQDYRSLSNNVSFEGDFMKLSISAQLQQRKLYVGLVIDDWDEFSLKGHVDILLNESIVTTIPIQKSYPPPIQIAPFNAAAGVTLAPAIMIPATQWDRIQSVDQFTDYSFEPEELIQNELRNTLSYDRVSDELVYIYFFRVSPLHLNVMATGVKFIIDKWVAVKSGDAEPNPGVMACYLACLSQRSGNS